MDTLDLQYGIFVVNDQTFCLWDRDLISSTLEFLNNIDPSHYDYLANAHFSQLKDGDEAQTQHAALSIRTAFSQGLETLFAFIFSALQAPHCTPAWMGLYRPFYLYKQIQKVNNYEKILTLVKVDHLSWEFISNVIHDALIVKDKEKEEAIKTGFAQLWSRFASTYMESNFRGEYNSIKHGLRIKPGGFSLAIGAQDEPGKPAPKERMRMIGKGQFGSSFFNIDQIEGAKCHFQMRRSSRNWDPEDMVWGLHLISMSITNIISSLKILNGVSADQVKFSWPDNIETFREPWKRSISLGVTSMTGFSLSISKDLISIYSKDELTSKYNDGEVTGIRRIHFADSPDHPEK